MKVSDLDYNYPPELVALEPSRPTRVAVASPEGPRELDMAGLLELFRPGDCLVVNETKVIPARVFSLEEVEILFLKALSLNEWQVLFPAREFKSGALLQLPGGITATLIQKGLPQVLSVSPAIGPEYFARFGEMALPPYIQEARGERRNRPEDAQAYQTAWAKNPGSVAAPTASLHFQAPHLEALKKIGVAVLPLTLHVGAGTFLPIKSESLNGHVMHPEQVEIPAETRQAVLSAKTRGARVWALGTTVTRALEAWAAGDLPEGRGETRIFIQPGHEFKLVTGLLTNFHQPKSTLLALVAAFAGLERVKRVYAWAVDHQFKLFSYGDLSVWLV